jgi:hypothetical protein
VVVSHGSLHVPLRERTLRIISVSVSVSNTAGLQWTGVNDGEAELPVQVPTLNGGESP